MALFRQMLIYMYGNPSICLSVYHLCIYHHLSVCLSVFHIHIISGSGHYSTFLLGCVIAISNLTHPAWNLRCPTPFRPADLHPEPPSSLPILSAAQIKPSKHFSYCHPLEETSLSSPLEIHCHHSSYPWLWPCSTGSHICSHCSSLVSVLLCLPPFKSVFNKAVRIIKNKTKLVLCSKPSYFTQRATSAPVHMHGHTCTRVHLTFLVFSPCLLHHTYKSSFFGRQSLYTRGGVWTPGLRLVLWPWPNHFPSPCIPFSMRI